MKTKTVINKTENKIIEKKVNIKKLARDYISTKSTARERRIFSTIRSEKKEMKEMEHLLKRLNNRKKNMPIMDWKRNKTLKQNILANLDKK